MARLLAQPLLHSQGRCPAVAPSGSPVRVAYRFAHGRHFSQLGPLRARAAAGLGQALKAWLASRCPCCSRSRSRRAPLSLARAPHADPFCPCSVHVAPFWCVPHGRTGWRANIRWLSRCTRGPAVAALRSLVIPFSWPLLAPVVASVCLMREATTSLASLAFFCHALS